jgi:hypothetical protein
MSYPSEVFLFPLSRLPLLVSVTVAAVFTLSAQQAPQEPAAALFRPNDLLTPFLAPVSGAPVTATFVIVTEWTRGDGSTETLGSTFQVARDSGGRISHELRKLEPAAFTGAPPLLGVVLYNPRTETSQTIDPVNRTDVELTDRLPNDTLSGYGGEEIVDLGRKMIAGLDVTGVRRTWRVPVGLSLTGQPSQTSDESWYSNRLHMIVSERRTDPLGGVVVITVSGIDRQRPPASLFKVPQRYQVIRKKRPANTHIARGESWSIRPPEYDPNDGFGRIIYPSSIR